jgi:hypothetical protein
MDRISEIIGSNPTQVGSAGPKSLELIAKAEDALAVPFPKSYKDFLHRWGVMWFGGLEYYGVINDDFENSSIPDVVWVNLRLRSEENFPDHLIVFSNRDGVQYWCMDTSKMDTAGECPIVLWDNVGKEVDASFEMTFADFVVDEMEVVFELD